jgi:hypothetical protein
MILIEHYITQGVEFNGATSFADKLEICALLEE